MAKRSKEEREEERKKELLRTLRRGPDLDRFIDEQKRNFVSYAQGARMYSMNYYSCLTDLGKTAGWQDRNVPQRISAGCGTYTGSENRLLWRSSHRR